MVAVAKEIEAGPQISQVVAVDRVDGFSLEGVDIGLRKFLLIVHQRFPMSPDNLVSPDDTARDVGRMLGAVTPADRHNFGIQILDVGDKIGEVPYVDTKEGGMFDRDLRDIFAALCYVRAIYYPRERVKVDNLKEIVADTVDALGDSSLGRKMRDHLGLEEVVPVAAEVPAGNGMLHEGVAGVSEPTNGAVRDDLEPSTDGHSHDSPPGVVIVDASMVGIEEDVVASVNGHHIQEVVVAAVVYEPSATEVFDRDGSEGIQEQNSSAGEESAEEHSMVMDPFASVPADEVVAAVIDDHAPVKQTVSPATFINDPLDDIRRIVGESPWSIKRRKKENFSLSSRAEEVADMPVEDFLELFKQALDEGQILTVAKPMIIRKEATRFIAEFAGVNADSLFQQIVNHGNKMVRFVQKKSKEAHNQVTPLVDVRIMTALAALTQRYIVWQKENRTTHNAPWVSFTEDMKEHPALSEFVNIFVDISEVGLESANAEELFIEGERFADGVKRNLLESLYRALSKKGLHSEFDQFSPGAFGLPHNIVKAVHDATVNLEIVTGSRVRRIEDVMEDVSNGEFRAALRDVIRVWRLYPWIKKLGSIKMFEFRRGQIVAVKQTGEEENSLVAVQVSFGRDDKKIIMLGGKHDSVALLGYVDQFPYRKRSLLPAEIAAARTEQAGE